MSLHSDGYQLYPGFVSVPPEVVTAMEKRAADAEPIFNDSPEKRRNDNKRRQVNLPVRGTWLRDLHTRLKAIAGSRDVHDLVLLESLPGCRRQAAHCDYVPSNELLKAADWEMPLLCLVALQDGTHLDLWPGSHRQQRPLGARLTLNLNAGDAVLFRGDLVHAGSAYEARNLRIHAYFDHPAVPREPNRTWILYKHEGIKEEEGALF
jgi:hypothetical protein